MGSVRELARMMNELDDRLAACMRCGLCQAVCPLYAQTGREADVARGKLALLDGLAKEMLDRPEEARERLERCLLCGSCQANCPSGVRVLDLFFQGRAILAEYLGLSPVKKAIFRSLLANPRWFDRLTSLGSIFQKAALKPADSFQGTSCARVPLFLGDRHMPSLARVPFREMTGSLPRAKAGSGPRVAFFVGCLIDKVFPNVGLAAAKALAHHGFELVLPENQACCGIPALAAGDRTAFYKLLDHNLKVFRPGEFDYLVTACATCTSTIKKTWETMAEGLTAPQASAVRALSAKTLDIGQFLNDMNKVEPRGPVGAEAERITYHDPCHLKKSLGVDRAPRRLLEAGGRRRLVEMAESDWCCGMGGSFNLYHYGLSRAIGARKIENIRAADCETAATGCPACMIQIMDGLSRAGLRIRVRHFIEIYADGLDADDHLQSG